MKTIYLVDWYNYGQRISDSRPTISDYDIVYSKEGINFSYNDDVNTNLDLNTDVSAPYLIVCNESNEIESRWFIIHKELLRGYQNRYYLGRDLIADFRDEFINSTIYIEKG